MHFKYIENKKLWTGLKFLGYGILIIVLFLQLYHAAMLSIDAHHDGTMFNPALIIARGGKMYKDTATYYGVLTTYIQAFFLKVFGETVMVMKLSAVIFYVFCFVLYYNIFKRLMPRVMVILTEMVLLYIAYFWMTTFMAWASVYALFFMLCYMYFCTRYFETGQFKYFIFIGISTALIFWSRTPCGFVFILSSVLLFIIIKVLYPVKTVSITKLIMNWGIGFGIGMAPFILTIIVQGTFLIWWNECIRHPFLSTFETAQVMLPSITDRVLVLTNETALWNNLAIPKNIKNLIDCLFPINNSGIYIIFPIANLYVFFVTFWNLFKSRHENSDFDKKKKLMIILSLTLCTLGSWHQYFAVSEIRHWFWAGFPMMGILGYLLYELFDKHDDKRWRIAISFMALLTISATTLYERFSYFEIRKERYSEEISEEICPILKGIKLSKEQREFYEDYCTIMEELAEKYPNRRFENRSFSRLLASIDNNDRDTIDDTKLPIIICNSKEEPEGKTTHYLAIEIEQHYPEQELDSYQWTVRFYLPKE